MQELAKRKVFVVCQLPDDAERLYRANASVDDFECMHAIRPAALMSAKLYERS